MHFWKVLFSVVALTTAVAVAQSSKFCSLSINSTNASFHIKDLVQQNVEYILFLLIALLHAYLTDLFNVTPS